MSKIIFNNCMIIDGISNDAYKGSVYIDGSVIYDISLNPLDDFGIAASDVNTIDLNGKTLMPGLFDCHIHLNMYGETDNLRNTLFNVPAYLGIRAAVTARKILEAGFTTVRCMGDSHDVDYALKRAINEGYIIGPKILSSGQAITITGGHGDQFPGKFHLESIGEICDGHDAVIRAVRDRVKFNADNIKMMATGGGTSPGPATVEQLPLEDMAAAVKEASKTGKITSAHAIGTNGIKNALKAGVRTIEHGSFLDHECIDLFLEKGAYLCSTLAAFNTIKYGPGNGLSQETYDKVVSFKTEHIKWLKIAHDAGVKIIAGTDCGTPYNYAGENAQELAELAKYALTPMEAIKAATSVAAEALLLNETGTIQKGKIADIIVVDGNPLENISIIADSSNIKKVYRNGRLLVNKE